MVYDKLGIDIGRVIIGGANDNEQLMFGDDYLHTLEVPGAVDSIKQLSEERFGAEKIFLVSKCGPIMEQKTREWLEEKKFYDRTGLNPLNTYFCRTRKGKAPIVERLGISVFIDDRTDVLAHLPSYVMKILFFEKNCGNNIPNGIRTSMENLHIAIGWQSVRALLLGGWVSTNSISEATQ